MTRVQRKRRIAGLYGSDPPADTDQRSRVGSLSMTGNTAHKSRSASIKSAPRKIGAKVVGPLSVSAHSYVAKAIIELIVIFRQRPAR